MTTLVSLLLVSCHWPNLLNGAYHSSSSSSSSLWRRRFNRHLQTPPNDGLSSTGSKCVVPAADFGRVPLFFVFLFIFQHFRLDLCRWKPDLALHSVVPLPNLPAGKLFDHFCLGQPLFPLHLCFSRSMAILGYWKVDFFLLAISDYRRRCRIYSPPPPSSTPTTRRSSINGIMRQTFS